MLEIFQKFFLICEIEQYLKEQLLENENIEKNILMILNDLLLF
jgi:hypothetical protein